jgi:signal transduction histidine kinase
VEFNLKREAADAVFVVRDYGIGIPEADQAQLFLTFHRGGNVGERPGTGLGLVIVKRCVELQGGSICLQSKPGKGTTGTVRLPLFGEPEPARQPGQLPARTSKRRGKKKPAGRPGKRRRQS